MAVYREIAAGRPPTLAHEMRLYPLVGKTYDRPDFREEVELYRMGRRQMPAGSIITVPGGPREGVDEASLDRARALLEEGADIRMIRNSMDRYLVSLVHPSDGRSRPQLMHLNAKTAAELQARMPDRPPVQPGLRAALWGPGAEP